MVQVRPGADSPFYLVEKRLIASGHARHPWETLSIWLKRIGETQPHTIAPEALESILSLHYRYRFDPEGLTTEEAEALKSNVHSWLGKHDVSDQSL